MLFRSLSPEWPHWNREPPTVFPNQYITQNNSNGRNPTFQDPKSSFFGGSGRAQFSRTQGNKRRTPHEIFSGQGLGESCNIQNVTANVRNEKGGNLFKNKNMDRQVEFNIGPVEQRQMQNEVVHNIMAARRFN